MTVHRFHVPSPSPGVMELPQDARAHATRVLRLGVGDPLRVFDQGLEFDAVISAVEKHRVLIDVISPLTPLPERSVPLHLIMSALKGDLTELVIQKATELGVARISPVVFERTDTVARRDPNPARLERWGRVVVGAAEQSGRAVVPRIDALTSLKEATGALGERRDGELRIVAAEPALGPEGTAQRAEAKPRSVVVAVGPAGGLSAQDLETLDAAGFARASFALHTLRSETACVAALAILGERFR